MKHSLPIDPKPVVTPAAGISSVMEQDDAAKMLAQLLRTLPLAFFMLDTRQTITLVSQEAAQFWGLPPTYLAGRSLEHFFIRIGLPNRYEATRRLFREKTPAPLNFFADRQQKWIALTAQRITAGFLLSFSDITLVKRQEEDLMRAIQETQETERKRISEALHNGVAQLLYAAKLKLDQIHESLLPALVEDYKNQADHFILEAIGETRRISHELMPGILDHLGLEAAVADIGRNLSSDHLELQCRVHPLEKPLEKPLQVAVYRIIQELANNIVKHAGASIASIQLRQQGHNLALLAEDNGKGFGHQPGQGLGLQAIRDRVSLLKGTMEINSRAQSGTLISIYLPLSAGD